MGRIVIIGAGPCGLGAAWRLNALGRNDWELWESADGPGGLSASFVDGHGYTWDLGGHVLFSHYHAFDALMLELLGPDGWLHHEREAWVRLLKTWCPFPFQYNIHRLPAAEQLECLVGLTRAAMAPPAAAPEAHFAEHIARRFGDGIARLFMTPYNTKVWAHPPADLSTGWLGERVPPPDLERVLRSVVYRQDDKGWGPNSRFLFPARGGTGAIWQALANRLPAENIRYGRQVVHVDDRRRIVRSADGVEIAYDALISTMPLDELVQAGQWPQWQDAAAESLRHTVGYIFGVALRGAPPADLCDKCWIYFPEGHCPFYRATVFSRYSPAHVPDPETGWSLMLEVARRPGQVVDPAALEREITAALLAEGFIASPEAIHHFWRRRLDKSYPVPTAQRDGGLGAIQGFLEGRDIFSRGRFGGWKYEVGNQDHCFMQGVEAVDRIVSGQAETTYPHPEVVNAAVKR